MVASGKSALKVQYPMLCHCQASFHFRRQKIDAHSLRIALANWRQISCPLYPPKANISEHDPHVQRRGDPTVATITLAAA